MHLKWREYQLGDVVTLQRGFDLPNRDRREGNVPIVSSSGVSGYHDMAKVKGPGVVTGRYGTLGEVFFMPQDFWPLNTTLYVRDFKGNDPLFISYFLRTLNFAHHNAAGAVPGVNRNALHLLPVRVPDPPTQRRIAAILSAYDDLIENNARRIAILEEMARNLYREWFVHFRFPGHENVEIVERDGVRVPSGWEYTTIREVSSYINRGVSPKYNDQSGSIVINQKCIRDERLNLELVRRHASKITPEKYVRFGDVLINSTGIGTLGRVAQVYQDIADCTVDSHVSIVRPSNQVGVDYFGFYLLGLQAHFDSQGVGSTGQTELGREAIAKTGFLLPPKAIQDCFGKFVSPMRKSVIQLAKKNANLRRTRDLLLPRLVSGELDVSELEIAGVEEA